MGSGLHKGSDRRRGNLRVGAGPDGKSENLGDFKDLRNRGRGIQYGGSSLGGARWDPEIGWGRAGRGGWAG